MDEPTIEHRNIIPLPRALRVDELRGFFQKISDDLSAKVRCQSLSALEFSPGSEVGTCDEDIKNGVIFWKGNQYFFASPKNFLRSAEGPPGVLHFSRNLDKPASPDELEFYRRVKESSDDYFS